MKTMLRSILIAACLAVATPAFAQTATPTPTPSATPTPTPAVGSIYTDGTQPAAARIADAQAVIALNASPSSVEAATFVLDQQEMSSSQATTWAPVQTLVQGIINSNGQYVASPLLPNKMDSLMATAVGAEGRLAFTTPDAALAWAKSITVPAGYTNTATSVKNLIGSSAASIANRDFNAGNWAQALTEYSDPQIMSCASTCAGALSHIAQIKSITHSADALSWAKAAYAAANFGQSQAITGVVRQAFQSVDMGIARGNAFIAAQLDTTVANPLTSTPYPPALITTPLPLPDFAAVNLVMAGNNVGALTAARTVYDSAADNGSLNKAVGFMAQALRDVDLNLVRANAFVAAQKAGQSYTITELQ